MKSDGGTKQYHYTTKSISIPYVPNGKSRDRVGAGGESRMPEDRGNSSSNLQQSGSPLVYLQ